MNKLIINGRLTKDMEVKTVNKNTLVASFTIANNVRYGGKEKTNFVRCTMFGGKIINALEEYLVKGCQVLIDGELQIDTVEDNKEYTSYTNVLVNRIEIEKFVNDEEKPVENNRGNRRNRR